MLTPHGHPCNSFLHERFLIVSPPLQTGLWIALDFRIASCFNQKEVGEHGGPEHWLEPGSYGMGSWNPGGIRVETALSAFLIKGCLASGLLETDIPVTLLGGIFVAINAYGRYDGPSSNRASTTAIRYHLSAIAYTLVTVLLYLLLIRARPILDQAWLQDLSSPLLAALAMTELVPRLPVAKDIELWARHALQRIAAIPTEVRRLSSYIENATFEPSESARAEAMQELEAANFENVEDRVATGQRRCRDWFKITVLLLQIERMKGDAAWNRYTREFSGDFAEIRRRREELTAAAQVCFSDAGAKAPKSRTARKAILAVRELIDREAKSILQSTYDFISRGVLLTGNTERSRRAQLRNLGFESSSLQSPPISSLTMIFVMLCPLLILVMLMMQFRGMSVNEKMARGLQVSFLLALSSFCGIYPRIRWPQWDFHLRRGDTLEGRPWGFYLAVSVAAAIVSMFFNILFKIAIQGSFIAALREFGGTYPFLAVSSASAFLTAFLCDNGAAWERWGRSTKRLIEGAAGGTILALTTIPVSIWLRELQPRIPYHVPGMPGLVLSAFGAGALIGVLAPSWYRQVRRGRISSHLQESALVRAGEVKGAVPDSPSSGE